MADGNVTGVEASASPTFECVISAEIFARALAAVSTEDTRYYLNGVNVEPCPDGGAILVSTDGSRMLVLRDIAGVVRGTGIVQLSKDMIRALTAKAWKLPNWLGPVTGRKRQRYLVVRGSKAAVAEVGIGDEGLDADAALALADNPTRDVGAYQWCGATLDAKFPAWRKVIGEPDIDGKAPAGLNVRLLAPIAEALRSRVSAKYDGASVRLFPSKDPNGPVFVFSPSSSAVDGFGILMPLREQVKTYAIPAWAQTQALAVEA